MRKVCESEGEGRDIEVGLIFPKEQLKYVGLMYLPKSAPLPPRFRRSCRNVYLRSATYVNIGENFLQTQTYISYFYLEIWLYSRAPNKQVGLNKRVGKEVLEINN